MGASTFDDYHAEPLQSLEAGDDVIVEVPQSGRGKRSGVVVEMPGYWQLYRMRNGKTVRVEIYGDRPEALEAAASGPRPRG